VYVNLVYNECANSGHLEFQIWNNIFGLVSENELIAKTHNKYLNIIYGIYYVVWYKNI
jgi:hypothetical protein